MPTLLVPGTKVRLSFYSFNGAYPPLYYSASEGTLNLASVNAGNSQVLCVGLGGVNGAFFTDLTTKANQKNVNLNNCNLKSLAQDDYLSRHMSLRAKAAAAPGKLAHEAYTATDPCSFSLANANQISNIQDWYEGVCFVDVFDPTLRPAANSKNVAMVYLAPPHSANHPTPAAFLAAITATARLLVQTVAAYNALAAQNQQPVIEALRNTLFSSNNYNTAGVPLPAIARAIYAGLAAELINTPNSGLVELQFPLGADYFSIIQTDLDPTSAPVLPIMALFEGGDGGVEVEDPAAHEPDFDVVPGGDAVSLSKALDFGARSATAEATTLKTLADSLLAQLKAGGALKPTDPVRYVLTSPDFATEPIVKTSSGHGQIPLNPIYNAPPIVAAGQPAAVPPIDNYGESAFSQLHLNEGNGGNPNPNPAPPGGDGLSTGAKVFYGALVMLGVLAPLAAVGSLIAFVAGGFKKASKLVLNQPSALPISTSEQTLSVSATAQDNETSAPLNAGTVTFSATTTAAPPVVLGTSSDAAVGANGIASGTITIPANTPTGSYNLKATYSGTTSGLVYGGSEATQPFTIGNVTITTITAPAAGAPTTSIPVEATVTANGAALTSGTVTFSLNTTPPTTASAAIDATTAKASASLTLPAALGSYQLTATYSGDTTNLPSSATQPFTVSNPALTITTITTPASDGASFDTGSQLNAEAAVMANGANLTSGFVSFSLSTTPPTRVGATIDATSKTAKATLLLPTNPGNYTLTATFTADANYQQSQATRTFTLTLPVTQNVPTVTTLAALPPNPTPSSALPVEATVTANGTPVTNGLVTFTLNSTPEVSVAGFIVAATGKASGTLTLPATPGTYTLTATYSGDKANKPSTATQTLTVSAPVVPLTPTTTLITVPANNGGNYIEGTNLTVEAVASVGTTPLTTGFIQFTLNTNPPTQATFTIQATGRADGTLPLTAPPGSYTLTATFLADATHATSSGTRMLNVVARTRALLTITAHPADAWVVLGGSVTFTAATPDTATVQWQVSTDGGAHFTALPNETNPSLTLSNLTAAQHNSQYRAVFSGPLGTATTKAATLAVSPVVYLGPDTTSHGAWTTTYGSEGYLIPAETSTSPAPGVTLTSLPPDTVTYKTDSTSADPRLLATTRQQPSSYAANSFVPAQSAQTFEFTATVTDGAPHQLTLYLLDWAEQTNSRFQTITVSDLTGATKYDTRYFANFEAGVYARWNISGSVKITVAEAGHHPVLCGIFIDPAPTAPDFRLDAAFAAVTVGGGTTRTAVPTIPANGFHGAPQLAAANWPAGITATFDASVVTLTVDSSVQEGRYTLPLTATSGALTTQANLLLGVNPPPMPTLRPVLVAADVTTGQVGAVDVLARGDSFHPKDATSVRITGLQSPLDNTKAPMALVGTDGKSLRVDGEGIWLVDQNGLVTFIADVGLDHPPTPIAVAYSDVKGNASNNALIVVDPGLAGISDGVKAQNRLDDPAFWKSFHQVMIDDPTEDLSLDAIAVALQGMVQTAGLAASIGPRNPVKAADFDAAYQKWVASKKSLRSLQTICTALVNNEAPTGFLRARFWTLLSMLQMTRQALSEASSTNV